MSFFRLRLAAALVAMLASFAPRPLPAQTAGPPVDLYVLLPLTGSGAFLGQAMAQTLKVLETRVNESGGIRNRPVRFQTLDTQTSPQIAVQLANDMIAKHVPVYFDGGPVATCNAEAPLLENGPVLYCLSPIFAPAHGGYTFATSVSTRDTLEALMRFFRQKHWHRLALIVTTDATGQQSEAAINDVLRQPENAALSLVEREHFAPADLSVSAQMTRIRAANADVLLAYGTGTPLATIYHGYSDTGLTLPVATGFGNMTYSQMVQYAPFMPKQVYFGSAKWPNYTLLHGGPVKDALRDYYTSLRAAAVPVDNPPSLIWDPVWLMVDALRKFGPDASPRTIRDHLASLHGWSGINGFYDFRTVEHRGLGVKDTAVSRWDPVKKTWVPEALL